VLIVQKVEVFLMHPVCVSIDQKVEVFLTHPVHVLIVQKVDVFLTHRVCVCVNCSKGGSDVDMSSPLNYGTPSSRLGDTPRTPGALGTPHRSRPDIRSERRPTVAVGASSELVTAQFVHL